MEIVIMGCQSENWYGVGGLLLAINVIIYWHGRGRGRGIIQAWAGGGCNK